MKQIVSCDVSACVGCNKCIRVCPLEEANVAENINGKGIVHLDEHKCIACGACIAACEHGCRRYQDDRDDFIGALQKGEKIAVLVDSSFKVDDGDWKRYLGWLKQLGVDDFYDVSLGNAISAWAHSRYIQKYGSIPGIDQACPPMTSYILMYRPELIEHLSPIHSPMLCVAIYLQKYRQVQEPLAAISPCIAKGREFEQTDDRIAYNVTFDKLKKYVRERVMALPEGKMRFDSMTAEPQLLLPVPIGIHSEIEYYFESDTQVLRCDGSRIYSLLEDYAKVKKSNQEGVADILDVWNCPGGCHFGTGASQKRTFLEVNKGLCAAKQLLPAEPAPMSMEELFAFLDKTVDLADFIRTYTPQPVEVQAVSNGDIERAFNDLNKKDKKSRNLNCGACGSDSCRSMAVKIAKGVNTPLNCIEKAHLDAMREKMAMLELGQEVEKARIASETKSRFLAQMSHEIRTPMNAILGMAELTFREELPPAAHNYVLNIRQAGNNLLAIINDILDISKIESGRLELVTETYSLASVINDVINITRMRIEDKSIFFVVNIDSNIPNALMGDEVRMRQIILNLLGNACKYCPSGFVSLKINCLEDRGSSATLKIEVSDSGIGIQKEDLEKLFNDFVQIDPKTNKGVEGTGLGLAITRSLCLAMGGDITVKSVYGEGSTFTAIIPQQCVSSEKIATVTNASSRRALVYEAREVCARSLSASLENLGVQCDLAVNISELNELLGCNSYTHLFAPSFSLESVQNITDRLGVTPEIILIAGFGEYLVSYFQKVIPMPAYAVPLANALNGVEDKNSSAGENRGEARFCAPQARILVVDDIETNLKVVSGLMHPYNMQIDLCSSGQEAIENVQQNRYDLIFMDHMMPQMDGIEATALIRGLQGEDSYYQSVPIIALTANAVTGVKEMFLFNGFDDFLAKPIDVGKLNAILNDWIPNNKKEQRVEQQRVESVPELQIEGLNVTKGVAMVGGDVGAYKETLAVFLRDAKEKIGQIEDCLRHKNILLYTTHVHALKSALGSIGATELSQLAQALEMAGRNEKVGSIEKHTGLFLSSLEKLAQRIDSALHCDSCSDADPCSCDDDVLKEELLALKESIQAMDGQALNGCISKLKKFALDKEVVRKIETIELDVLLCEHESALIGIDSLLCECC